MALKDPDPKAIREAQRGLLWAFLLALAILAGIVALLSGLTLLRLWPYAPALWAGQPVQPSPGVQINPSLLWVSLAAFGTSTGLLLASVWALRWLKRAWASSPVEALPKRRKKRK
ncbi:hypothetical protein Mlute_02547 [Meiothermus luteus]|uniref:Uncharacterized protein n=1 Tax=Meiothermus luteus TaxID=2026184 RepID=A0A399EJF2_9DEIN|nr:hypothetical protein [Meiothermus luteus]RIH82281.1 hypothetical protein Mlute_02547 [Meiothermus luteus]RMH54539.1 MAG: hypothetical protein D6684_09515 [Deinococcota bacterium]